jgi:hypothetical protein
VYPENTYITAVGSGDSGRDAEQRALAGLSCPEAAGQLERCAQFDRFGLADAGHGAQGPDTARGDPGQISVEPQEQVPGEVEHGPPRAPGAQEDGQEFGVAQGGRTGGLQAFAWSFMVRQFRDQARPVSGFSRTCLRVHRLSSVSPPARPHRTGAPARPTIAQALEQ